MLRGIFIVLLGFAAFATTAQRPKKSAKPLSVFSVNNRQVSAREFIYLYRKNHQNKKEDYTKEKINEYLDLYINFKLKVEEARSRGIDTTQAFIKEYNTYKDELRKPYLPEGKLVDSLVRLTYERMKEEVRVSHILISLKPDPSPQDTVEAYKKILEIRKRALTEDFGSLAASYSEDPSAQTNKGDLGYFTALQMVYPFESAAYSGKPDEIVGPVRTRFGYHILRIEDRKPSRGEVEVSHIMIRTGGDKDEQKKDLTFEIHEQLSGGVAWDELCKKYSEDQNSKDNGGKLRPFGVGAMAAVPEFDRAAFALQKPGDFSDPVKTAYGYHIIRLERKISLAPLQEIAPSLRNRVARDERVQISKQALMDKLKREFSFSENKSVKEKVFALADSTLTIGKWKINSWPPDEALFTIAGRQVPVSDFVSYIRDNQRSTRQSPSAYIVVLYSGFTESIINRELEQKLIRTNLDYEMLLTEYYEGILLFDIMEKEVWNKAGEDSVGQRKYFEANAANYKAGERVQCELYSSNVKETMASLTEFLNKKDTTAINDIIQSKKVRKESGKYQKTDRAVFSSINWAPGLHSTENNGMYYLARILEILPPAPLSFDEARASVISDYQSFLEKDWIEKLKKKYPVQINESGKKYVLQELSK